MIKNQVLRLLKDCRTDLTKYHVKALYLFGSVARDEESPHSDVDILVSFDNSPTFDLFMDLKFFLEDLFKRKVDLITESGLRPELRKNVNKDLIRAA